MDIDKAKEIVEALRDRVPLRGVWMLLYVEPDGRPASMTTLPLDLAQGLLSDVWHSYEHGTERQVLRACARCNQVEFANGKGGADG